MQSYYQGVGQRVSAWFGGGGGGNQGFNNMNNGGGGGGMDYNGQQQQMAYAQQGGFGQSQGGYNGQQQGGYGQQGAYQQQQQAGYQQQNMQQGGYGGNSMGGMEYNRGGGGGGGNFQFTQDAPQKPPQQRSNRDLKKPAMTPGTRRSAGFQCTTQLWIALFAILTVILAGGLTAGLVINTNTSRAKDVGAANAAFQAAAVGGDSIVPTTSPSEPEPTKSPTKQPTTKPPTKPQTPSPTGSSG